MIDLHKVRSDNQTADSDIQVIKHVGGYGRGSISPVRGCGSTRPTERFKQGAVHAAFPVGGGWNHNSPIHARMIDDCTPRSSRGDSVTRSQSPAFGGSDSGGGSEYLKEDWSGLAQTDRASTTLDDPAAPSTDRPHDRIDTRGAQSTCSLPLAGNTSGRASISTAVGSANDNDCASTRSGSQQRLESSFQGSGAASPVPLDNEKSQPPLEEEDREELEARKRMWEQHYSNGNVNKHRKKAKERKKKFEVAAERLIKYPASGDPSFPYQHKPSETIFECFNLKVIFERDKTGFQDQPEFRADPGSLVAGRYRVISQLGQAAFSHALKCFDEWENRDVCMKVIKNEKDFVDQSLDEVQVLRYVNCNGNVDSFHCLKMYDFFYYKEHLIIITELLGDNLYVFNKKLRDSFQPPYFTLGRIQFVAKQLLEALAFIHSLRLIHCDLKPENVLMLDEKKCSVKIIDFGSTCFEDDDLGTYVQSRSYRAPEVLLELPYDHKIDMWSLGCILAELWTGYVLFQNENVASLLARVVGIIGQIPYYMAQRAPVPYFTADGQLCELIGSNDRGRAPRFPTESRFGAGSRDRERMYRILVPKSSSLEQRFRVNDAKFVDFIRSLLQIDPCQRPTALEALKHPWLQPGLYPDGV
eukprot:Selendium_serpulae@DN6274_c2_g1_i1.p1